MNYENLSILVAITGLLGYVIKQIVPRLMKKIDEKDAYIKQITSEFTAVQNHKTTEMTEALRELRDVNKELVATLIRRN